MSHFQQEIRAHEPLVCGTLKFELAKRMPCRSHGHLKWLLIDRHLPRVESGLFVYCTTIPQISSPLLTSNNPLSGVYTKIRKK